MRLRFGRVLLKAVDKVHQVLHEYKHGELHSGAKSGPRVKSRKQAIAIALSEAGKAKKKKRAARLPDGSGFMTGTVETSMAKAHVLGPIDQCPGCAVDGDVRPHRAI